jgi:non-specific serine/threonine protein kinase
MLEQSLAGWSRLGYATGAANALFQLGLIALFERWFADAHARLSQALALHREAQNVIDACYDLVMLGFVEVELGKRVEARRHLAEAGEVMADLDDHWGPLFLLECTAALAASEGDATRALRLLGAASALRERTGVPLPPAFRESFEPWFLAARKALPAAAAEAAIQSGRALAPGQSISGEQLRALTADDTTKGGTGTGRPGRLSRREQQVAVFVAQGWTNQAVADALVVSRRTVDSHLSHILDKLGLTTRAQVAVWVAQNGLLGNPQR